MPKCSKCVWMSWNALIRLKIAQNEIQEFMWKVYILSMILPYKSGILKGEKSLHLRFTWLLYLHCKYQILNYIYTNTPSNNSHPTLKFSGSCKSISLLLLVKNINFQNYSHQLTALAIWCRQRVYFYAP